MSHNGIGLQTPRGSGTSGYVQKSLAGNRSEGHRRKREREFEEEKRKQAKLRIEEARKNAGAEIVAHDRKRLIELKCLQLRDELEDRDEDDDEIEKQIKALRAKLTRQEEKKDTSRTQAEEQDLKTVKRNEFYVCSEEEEVLKPKGESTTNDVKGKQENDRPLPYKYIPRYSER